MEEQTLQAIWEKKFKIHSYESGYNRRARLTAICNYFQEAAWEHAEHLAFGFSDLKEKNRFWVLSRFYLEVSDYPEWNENVTVETWPRGIDRLFALRDYLLKREDGSACVRSASAWLIVDAETKRPLKSDVYENVLHLARGRKACGKHLGKLPGLKERNNEKILEITQSDIDPNRHVNNVKYIEWLTDLEADLSNSQTGEIKSLEIHFLGEAFFGEQVKIFRGPDPESPGTPIMYEGVKGRDSTPVFRAQAVWK